MVLLALLVGILSAAAGVSLWLLLQERGQAQTAALIVLPEPRQLSDFSLVDQDGQPFRRQDLEGRWTLVFFGFTYCPDVCPSTLYDLQTVQAALGGGDPARHQVLFVSVDPERDTPERIREYLGFFDPAFLGVTGTHEELEPFARQMSVAYRIEEHEPGAAQYSVDHTASILLVEPSGRLHGVFPAPHDAEAIAADMIALLD